MSVWDENPAPSPITSARQIAAEGARVAVVSCRRCGAALFLDPAEEENVVEMHVGWHLDLDRRSRR